MKITPEELKDALQELRKHSEYPATCYDYARVLRKHIDAQAARIDGLKASLESACRQNQELAQQCGRFGARVAVAERKMASAEKELAALDDVAGSNAARVKELERELEAQRNDVSTWETMRKANGLPDTIGATILLAASLRQELAALRTDNETLVAVNSELANELEVLRAKKNQPLPKNLDNALTVMGVSLPIPESELALESARWVQRLIDRVIRVGDKLSPAPVAVPSGCSHDWISSEGRTTSGVLCSKCGDYNGPAPVAVPEEMNYSDGVNFVLINGMSLENREALAMRVWNACIAQMLRLNSGSKPFVVKLPKAADTSNLPFVCLSWNAYREAAIKAIEAAGGTVSDE